MTTSASCWYCRACRPASALDSLMVDGPRTPGAKRSITVRARSIAVSTPLVATDRAMGGKLESFPADIGETGHTAPDASLKTASTEMAAVDAPGAQRPQAGVRA